jgi:hypothetical protein
LLLQDDIGGLEVNNQLIWYYVYAFHYVINAWIASFRSCPEVNGLQLNRFQEQF